jgi:hypothetical protein
LAILLSVRIDLDLGDDVVAPVGDGLDRIPDLVDLILVLHHPREVELALALLRRAFHAEALGHLDRVIVFVSQVHL